MKNAGQELLGAFKALKLTKLYSVTVQCFQMMNPSQSFNRTQLQKNNHKQEPDRLCVGYYLRKI